MTYFNASVVPSYPHRTVLGNLKSGLSGAYHAFGFDQYAERYLGAIAYRFNRRFDLKSMFRRLAFACAKATPRPYARVRVVYVIG